MFDTLLMANPAWYFFLLLLAGNGLGVSEDALAVWVGGLIGRGELLHPVPYYIGALYAGVVLSDTWTFLLGRFAHSMVGERLKKRVFRDPKKADRALLKIQKYGDKVGFVQRFSIGARLGIAFMAGFSGISLTKFVVGTMIGAGITLPLQLGLGYLMRAHISKAVELIRQYGWIGAVIVVGIFVLIIRKKLKHDID